MLPLAKGREFVENKKARRMAEDMDGSDGAPISWPRCCPPMHQQRAEGGPRAEVQSPNG